MHKASLTRAESTLVAPMGVAGVNNLVERAYRESGELQYIRELYKNAEEAGATRIEIGPEWQGVENSGIYRLMHADNGRGMGPVEVIQFLNTFGGGGKPIGDAHENYGVGMKTSTLPWNRQGVVVLAYEPLRPNGCMVRLRHDPVTGDYGAMKFKTADGSYEEVVEPFDDPDTGIDWRKVKPAWIEDHGTIVVLLGDTGKEHTFLGKDGTGDIKGISKYLNERLWDVKPEVYVQEVRSSKPSHWPRTLAEASGKEPLKGTTDRRWNRRRIRGARYFVQYPMGKAGKPGHAGTVTLKDGTELDWFYWNGDRPKVHAHAHEHGYIAALYDGELYDTKDHAASFRRFGLTTLECRKNVTIIARPPRLAGGFGVYPDTARNTLKIKGTAKAGAPLPWDEWGEEFVDLMPDVLRDAIMRGDKEATGSLTDKKWRDRFIERFGSRLKRFVLKVRKGGRMTVDPTEAGSKPRKIRKPAPPGPREGGGTGGRGGTLVTGTEPGKHPAVKTTARGGLPLYRWVSEATLGEPGRAAVWTPRAPGFPDGVVELNLDFAGFREVFEHWTSKYPDYHADAVRKAIKDVYGQSMVARIAHSEGLIADARWGRRSVDKDLRSPAALTMAALGLVSEDVVIAKRLVAIVGRKRTKAA